MATEQVSGLVVGLGEIKKGATEAGNGAPEGVVVAPATRSPDASKAKSTPAAAPPVSPTTRPLSIPKELIIDMVDDLTAIEASGRGHRTKKPKKFFGEAAAPNPPVQLPAPANRTARPLPIPKELIIDIIDDLTATEDTGRGKRARKPKKFFGETAAPSMGKQKLDAFEEATPTTAAYPPSTKRVKTRGIPTVAGPSAASTTPVKRKRAADDDAAAATAPPPQKKRATNLAVSTAQPPLPKTKAASRAASTAPPPRMATRSITNAATASAPMPAKSSTKSKTGGSKGKATAKVEKGTKPKTAAAAKGKGNAKKL